MTATIPPIPLRTVPQKSAWPFVNESDDNQSFTRKPRADA
jgi:hypothetical protein